MSKFQPNKLTFADGIDRIRSAWKEAQGYAQGEIVTSKDENSKQLLEILRVTNVPDGFTKYQLPVFMEGGPGAQFFISVGSPNTKVPRHSHDEGDGIRFMLAGSINYQGKELGQGDWMFIPKGAAYDFEVGPHGASMCYCYSCCCA